MDGLNQISISYLQAEDRLLFRFSTRDGKEYRLALTRRFTLRGLWPGIQELLLAAPEIRRLADEDQKKAMLSFQHEGMVDKAAFTNEFDDENNERPLGDEPLLVTGLRANSKEGRAYILRFQIADQREISLSLDKQLFHNFCKLLANMINSADWDETVSLSDDIEMPTEQRVH